MITDLRRTILALIAAAPTPPDSKTLYAAPELRDEEGKRISNFLFLLKKDGQAQRDQAGRYTLTAKGREYLKSGGSQGADKKPSARGEPVIPQPSPSHGRADKSVRTPAPAPAHTPATTRALFEKLLADTQTALDEYVYAIGDKQILDHLTAARNGAREALAAFERGGK